MTKLFEGARIKITSTTESSTLNTFTKLGVSVIPGSKRDESEMQSLSKNKGKDQ